MLPTSESGPDTHLEGFPCARGWRSRHLSEREPGSAIGEDGMWTRGPGQKTEALWGDAPGSSSRRSHLHPCPFLSEFSTWHVSVLSRCGTEAEGQGALSLGLGEA